MLKKAYRLKSRGDFKRVLSKGRRLCANDCFLLLGFGDNPGQLPRFGFIISKKVHKRAVIRNRIRRRLRELVHQTMLLRPGHPIHRYRVLVFIVRSGGVTASFQDLKNRLERCFPPPV